MDDLRHITNIIGLFAKHIDGRDFRSLAELFSDMTYTSNGIDYQVSGVDDLALFYERVVDEANLRFAGDEGDARTVGHKHGFTNVIVDIDDDRQSAHAEYYGTVWAFSDAKSFTPRWNGRYIDDFRVIDGRWRIVNRLQITDYPRGYRPADDVRPS